MNVTAPQHVVLPKLRRLGTRNMPTGLSPTVEIKKFMFYSEWIKPTELPASSSALSRFSL